MPNIVSLEFGVHSAKGRRMTMEDRHVALVHPQFNEEVKADSPSRRAFFAVYDGHGGHVCAEYCKRHLHHNLSQDPKFGVEEKDALFNCIMTTEDNFYNAAKGFNLRSSSGTCAIIAYFVEDTLYVGNVGDSRSVLCRNGKAVPMSVDHKPDLPEERARVEAVGGHVAKSEGAPFKEQSCFCSCDDSPYRIYPGGLAVSRTIGDIGLKSEKTKLIIAEPDIEETIVTPEDEFLIIACDGLWDVIKNQEAVNFIKKEMSNPQTTLDEVCEKLVTLALKKGSTDNISLVIVAITVE